VEGRRFDAAIIVIGPAVFALTAVSAGEQGIDPRIGDAIDPASCVPCGGLCHGQEYKEKLESSLESHFAHPHRNWLEPNISLSRHSQKSRDKNP
jgi:hypothetical protein